MTSTVESTAGPLLVFICIGLVLFGLFVAQIYYYWLNYENDDYRLKSFVAFVAFLEVAHTVFCIISLYSYLVIHFGDVNGGINNPTWSLRATVPPEISIVVLTQALYIWRIWQLSGKALLPASIPAAFVIARLGVGIVGFYYLCLYHTWDQLQSHASVAAVMNCIFAFELTTDVIIAGELVYFLSRRRTQIPTTNAVVHKLMIYVINSGVITIFFSAGLLLTYNLLNSLVWMGIVQMMGKLYANTMLAMLNARRTMLQRDGGKLHAVEIPTRRSAGTRIHIYTETEVATDAHARANADPRAETPSSEATKDSHKLHDVV